jgi:16S rRNA (cytosine967-C5)-methyltransferase
MTVRANLIKNDRAALAAALAGEGLAVADGRWSPTALQVTTRTNLFGLAAFKAGRFEAQDEGSQLCAELVAPPPRALVVDGCAGAGGKTLAIAAALGNRGRVLAADVDERKLTELKRRARRAGATTVQAIALDADELSPWPAALARAAERVDRILLDVPCSGVGALRRNPEARGRLQPSDLVRLPALQRRIAERFLPLLAPGGRLIYATCTLLRAENQAVIEALAAEHGELEPVPVKEVWGAARAAPLADPEGRYLTLAPHRHGTDGFFAAVLRRKR